MVGFLPTGIIAYIPLLIWFLFSVIWLSRRKKNAAVIESIPNGFATTGVLGTFIGIAIGLWNFDVNDISGSIPSLLSGLMQSFVTSIVGIVLSMIAGKIIEYNFYDELENVDGNTKELKKIISLLETSNHTNQKLVDEMNTFQQKTVSNLFGALESSISQGVDNVVETLDRNNEQLFQKIAEMNSKELLKAMEQSVEVFNDKMEDILTRLIAKNFDTLNTTVQNMNDWQDQHKNNMTELIQQNTQISNHLRKTGELLDDRFKSVLGHVEQLTNEGGRLQKIIQELENITLGENQFKQIIDRAVESTAALSTTMDGFGEIVDEVRAVKANNYRLSESIVVVLQELQELAQLKEVNGEYWQTLRKGSKELNDNLNDIDDHFKESLGRTLESLDKLMQGYIVDANRQN